MSVAFVQAAGNPTSYGTPTCAFPSNNAVGNFLICWGRFSGNTSVPGITDTLGNNWINIPLSSNVTGGSPALWVCYSCKAGANTVTLSSLGYYQFCVAEYSGVGGIEQLVTGSLSGTTPSVGNLANSQSGSMAVVGIDTENNQDPSAYTAGSGYTLRAAGANVSSEAAFAMEDQYLASPSTVGSSMNTPSANSGVGIALILSPAAPKIYTINTTHLIGASSVGSISAPALKTTTGNCMVVAVSCYQNDPASVVSSVQDTAGNSYTYVTGTDVYANNAGVRFYICPNATGNAANVIKVNFSSNQTYATCYVWEVVGAALSSPVETVSTGTGNSTTPLTGNLVTSNANDLILAFCWSPQATFTSTPNSGYVASLTYLGAGIEAAANCPVTPGTYTAGFTFTSAYWSIAAIALKAASTFTGVPNSLMMMGCGT
jgi:hypothetical protein